ncbi:MAG: hypothetical protein WC455_17895 [Dehalococcoidia bacterium]
MKPLFIKWYPSQWLHSTARDEMNAAERATFHDFVCLAAISMTTGSFKFASVEGLSRTLNTEASIIENTIKVCVEKRRISVSEDVEGSIIRILKWETYQSLAPVNIKPKKRRIKVNVKTDSSLSDLDINIPSSSIKKKDKKESIRLILDDGEKRWEGISDDDKILWRKTYGRVDVDFTLQEMISYWDAQPRSTLKLNWKRAIVNRFKWIQDHAKAGNLPESQDVGRNTKKTVRKDGVDTYALAAQLREKYSYQGMSDEEIQDAVAAEINKLKPMDIT